ncbi:MAG: hypothetical protein Pyrs2KO_02820 [Pyruvatibacter sp.]
MSLRRPQALALPCPRQGVWDETEWIPAAELLRADAGGCLFNPVSPDLIRGPLSAAVQLIGSE